MPDQTPDLGHPAAGNGRPVAEVTSIVKRYDMVTALDEVSMTVQAGQSHALVGRNGAGKSTLVAILTGLQAPDSGEVRFDGEPAPPIADRRAWQQRVACVYQKSTVIPALSVAENLFLNRQTDRGLIRWGRLRTRAQALLKEWGVHADPARPAAELTVEQRQMVEIARALSHGARLIILDEPTAQLDATGIARLFERIRAMQAQGVTFLFISHHLGEIYEICQTVTVLRDGRRIVTAPVAEMPEPRLVGAMTGDAVALLSDATDRPPVPPEAPVVLAAEGLTLAGEYEGIDVRVRAGEMVGLAGGGASGAIAVGESLVGLRTPGAGTVEVAGHRVRRGSVPAALAAGVGFVPEDRHREGLVPLLSVAENTTLPITERLGRFGFVSPRRRREVAGRFVRDLDIKVGSLEQEVTSLSGGNQQKVVLARGLANQPRALVLLSPTAGVDVRSKEALLATVADTARRGTGVLVVSDELDDLRPCDRVVVMFKGRTVREYPRGWTDAELVGAMEGVSR